MTDELRRPRASQLQRTKEQSTVAIATTTTHLRRRLVPPARHLLRAKDLIDARYREPLDVAALARAARLSPAHFSREFRAAFGETPHQYLLTRRLERAAALLRTTDHSVIEVCSEVGLRSVGSFTTSFGRAYGMSPTAYRAAHPPAATRVFVPTCILQAYGRPRSSSFREDGAAQAR
jgi:AraC-like DNA-binding protein